MGIDIGGVTLNSGSSSVVITNNSNAFTLLNNGTVYAANTPMFCAGSTTDPGYTYPGATWHTMAWPHATYNVGTCYNTSTYVFTAPISGVYFFSYNCYITTPVANSDYVHPTFLVNGAHTGFAGAAQYRIRHHGGPASAYCDTDCCEIFKLNAADTVQAYCYFANAGIGYYKYYGQFDGVLLTGL